MSTFNDEIEEKIITLKTISPIHIRGKDIEYGQGFIKKDSNFAYKINHNKLGEYLCEKGGFELVKKYVEFLEEQVKNKNREDDKNRIEYFLGYNLHGKLSDNEKDEMIKQGVINGEVNIGDRENYFIKTGGKNSKPFIPGSSIKGAIKTAVMYKILKDIKRDNPNWFHENVTLEVIRKIDEYNKKNGNKDTFKRTFSENIINKIFKEIGPKDDSNIQRKNDKENDLSFKDFFRIIKISDNLNTLNKSDFLSKKILILTLKNKNEPANKKILEDKNRNRNAVECYCSKSENLFKITIDKGLMNRFLGNYKNSKVVKIPFDSIDSLIKILNDFSNDLWLKEAKYFNNLGTTIDSELDDSFNNKDIKSPLFHYGIVKKVTTNYGKDIYFIKEINNHSKKDIFLLKNKLINKNKELIKDGAKVIFMKDKDNLKRDIAINVFTYNYDTSSFSNAYNLLKINDFNKIKTFYSAVDKPNIRIGWGAGLLGMTIDMLLDPITQKLLRDEVLLLPERNRLTERNLPAPKSKRLILGNDNTPEYPLGWCKLEIKND